MYLVLGAISKEQVKIALEVRLRGVLDNAVIVSRVGRHAWKEEEESAEAIRCNDSVAILELLLKIVQDTLSTERSTFLGQRTGGRSTITEGSLGLDRLVDSGGRRRGAFYYCLGRTLGDLGIKVNIRVDKIDVGSNMLRNIVLRAGNVAFPNCKFLQIVFGLEEILGFDNSGIEIQPAQGLWSRYPLGKGQPSVDCLCIWCLFFGDTTEFSSNFGGEVDNNKCKLRSFVTLVDDEL